MSFKLCEDHPDQCVLWLSSSEYIFKMQLDNRVGAGGGLIGNDTNRNLNVPRNYTAANSKRLDSRLFRMCCEQNLPTHEQTALLNQIGFQWTF